ncbi:unnamed protein product, partial [Rotaria sordida]
ANIFMWKWQKEFVRRQHMTGEFYGRYIDDIFMTWNKSKTELKTLLEQANTWHRNIKLEHKISQSLPFLDILLTNKNGILSTGVYHKPAAEPYVVPFLSDHSRHTFVNVIQTTLARASESINGLMAIRKQQGNVWEELLMLEMRVLCKFLPENFDHLEDYIAPISYSPLNNNQKLIRIRNQHYKIIQEAKREWLNCFLNTYDAKFKESDQQYRNEIEKLEAQLLNNTIADGSSVVKKIHDYMTYQTDKLKQNIHNKILSFRGILLQNHQRVSPKIINMIGVSPEPYLDLIFKPFNKRQWFYLSLGPSYIRLNQSAIRPRDQQESTVTKEHKNIYDKIAQRLSSHPYNVPSKSLILKQYSSHLLEYLNNSYFTPLSYKDQLRAIEQAKTTACIRKILKKHNLILRITDKGHNFYIGSETEFEKKAQKFFEETNAFMELSANPLKEIQDKVIQSLNRLREKKLILVWQYNKMMPDRTKSELAHLYFNPKTHKEDIPVRPIENTIHAPTTNISKFLSEIISPIFNSKCLFKPSTLFCTLDIRNLYTMLPQEEALNILVEFLRVHGYEKVKGIPLDTIRQLASLVLQENVFVYNKKIYKQVLGDAMDSSFTLTLANIFMWKWQKEFVRRQDRTGEFYGRYIDDIFMTWNKSETELKNLLEQANTWHPNIKLGYKISQSLPFLDILLMNKNGILSTGVYHKPAAEPYVAPFLSDHSRHTFVNVIQTTLTRAQVLGGAMGSSFTLTLANIFMWKWQKEFVRRQDMIGEFYGRYIDDIFMTWNKSETELKNLLEQANTWHPNIKLEYQISQSLPFLDILLTNKNGILSTGVYHKPAAEPYVVPFLSDHSRHTFVNVIQTTLARANFKPSDDSLSRDEI